MSGSTRKPVVSAEATQELRASDVINVLGPPSGAGRKSVTSQSSIAPVGLDLAGGHGAVEDDEEELAPALEVRTPARRRQLGKIVAGAVGACALILVAAGVARISRASDEPATSQGQATQPAATAATPPPAAQATTPAPATVAGMDPSSSGTVRLDKPARAGHVWLDGKRISGTSVVLSCGTHQIKVGRSRKHSIDVPCGGEIGVSR